MGLLDSLIPEDAKNMIEDFKIAWPELQKRLEKMEMTIEIMARMMANENSESQQRWIKYSKIVQKEKIREKEIIKAKLRRSRGR